MSLEQGAPRRKETMPKWSYIQLQVVRGSACDKEIEDLKKVTGLKTGTAILRLALHSYWRRIVKENGV